MLGSAFGALREDQQPRSNGESGHVSLSSPLPFQFPGRAPEDEAPNAFGLGPELLRGDISRQVLQGAHRNNPVRTLQAGQKVKAFTRRPAFRHPNKDSYEDGDLSDSEETTRV